MDFGKEIAPRGKRVLKLLILNHIIDISLSIILKELILLRMVKQ